MKNNSDFRNIKHWVFDLDNTLYPASSNLFNKIDIKMKEFIINELKLKPDEAYKIQKKYYIQYGTTLAGLMKNNNIKPEKFLEYVHNIDTSSLKVDLRLNDILKLLPGTLYIYTNGSKQHAINVMKRLQIDKYINNIFDIKSSNFIPKPAKESLNTFIKTYNINPKEAVFFEDIPQNLINAKKIGFKTVLIKSNSHPDKDTKIIDNKNIIHKYIDITSYDLPAILEEICLDING